MARRTLPLAIAPLLLSVATAADGSDPPKADPAGVEFFEKRVRPLLAESCYGCHGPEKQRGGMRLDSLAGVLKGGDRGPAVVPGKPDESRLIRAARLERWAKALRQSSTADPGHPLYAWVWFAGAGRVRVPPRQLPHARGARPAPPAGSDLVRPPTAAEQHDALDFLQRQTERYRGGSADPRAWADPCHVLFNVKEFIFID